MATAEERKKKLRKRLLILAIVLLVGTAILAGLANVLTEFWWFEHLGFDSVFLTVIVAQIGIGFAFGLIALAFLLVHILVIRKRSKPRKDWTIPTAEGDIDIQDLVKKVSTPVIIGAAIVVATVMGVWASRHWEDVLKYFNQTSFGRVEPILDKDFSFYLFVMPAMQFVQEWLIYLTGACAFFSAAVYFFRGAIKLEPGKHYPEMSPGVRGHLLAAIACVLVVIAWGFRIEMFETLFSKRGVAYGATYTDVFANLVAYRVMIGACIVAAIYLLVLGRGRPTDAKQAIKRPGIALAVVAGLYIIGIFILPTIVQKVIVAPNELEKEKPYLVHAIAGTRNAYELDRIQVKQFPATENLTISDINRNRPTIDNVKLWDPRPLRDTYRQLQVIRLYYDFPNISIDRYWVNNRYRQVMLSAREMVHSQLPAQSRTWVNQHLQYTHGYGACLSPVNQVVGEGLPDLWVKDIPPTSPPRFGFSAKRNVDYLKVRDVHSGSPAEEAGLKIGDRIIRIDDVDKPAKVLTVAGELLPPDRWKDKLYEGKHKLVLDRHGQQVTIEAAVERFDILQIERPELYYGLQTTDYALVKTTIQEFDFPKSKATVTGETENAYTTYKGKGGVGIGSFFRRLLFAIRFADINLLFTAHLKPESRILFNRTVQQRVYTVAPFLMLDQEPYMVIADGRLHWIQDAYTISYRFPYSQPTTLGRRKKINYLRNSVKVVIDAFNGSMSFYVWDDKDPMIQTYKKIFPALFKKKDEMPKALRGHVRYPKDLFTIQAMMYESFHMTDPQVFYNQEDKWNISRELVTKPSAERTGTATPGVAATEATARSPMQPYYMIMRLPEFKKEEFLLMIPYTPTNKDNMVAWMSAGCDEDNYGKLLVYAFPKKTVIYGPMQVHARIDQDKDISKWFTLRDQKGSKVFRGDLLVIPIEDSILYVEPIYLEAVQAQLPELKQVIVAFGNRLAMKDDLAAALKAVFGVAEDRPIARMPATTQPTSEPASGGGGNLASQALRSYREAQNKLKAGDWAGYGAEQDRLRLLLEQLAKQLSGSLQPKR